METSKIQHFQAETGASLNDARAMLQGSQWDVAAAIKSFRFLQCSARPPVGPQKNCVASESAAQGLKVGTGPAMDSLKEAEVKYRINDKTPASPNSQSRRLLRGLSKTSENIQLVNKARDLVLGDIVEKRESPCHIPSSPHFVDTPEYTFILPDLTKYPDDFRAFLHKDLIETSTLVSLEQAGRLNWWADIRACQRLLPLATTGDGNCLLHAASLGMWGFHDRLLTLRKALHTTLTNAESEGGLWRRWRWHQTLLNKQSGLIYDEKEWRSEWLSLLRLSSSEPRTAPGQRPSSCCNSLTTKGLTMSAGQKAEEVFYESLEELHVFVLAHVLRRPVIVVADTILKDSNGDALAPIPFGGIYLPLECNPADCHRSPLLLTYDAAHFSALVPMEADDSVTRPAAACPLVDPDFRLLPIHFLVDPGPQFVWSRDESDPQKVNNLDLATDDQLAVISRYLEVQRVSIPIAPLAVGEEDEGDMRPRCNSWSSEPPALTRTDSVELKKDKTKARMQSVAKSFGSIGRTMSKKIKKNFTFRRQKTSIANVTQSTKTSSLPSTGDGVLCALLMHKRLAYQQQMMDNYLSAAEQRFNQDRDIRRQQDVEMKQRVELRRCLNPECAEMGAASTSHFCSSCFEEQKALNRGTMTISQAQEFERNNTLVTSGKSRFYTYSSEQHNLGGLHPDSEQRALNNESMNNAKEARQASVVLARSSFYDEPLTVAQPEPGTAVIVRNNLKQEEDGWRQEEEPPLRAAFAKHLEEKNAAESVFQQLAVNGDLPLEGKYITSVNMNSKGQDAHKSTYKDPQSKCVTQDCEFYGSQLTDFLCSKCFRERGRTLLQLADRSTIL